MGTFLFATDGHNSLAMLVRHRGETLAQLLTRLDLAIARALTEDSRPTTSTRRPPERRDLHNHRSFRPSQPFRDRAVRNLAQKSLQDFQLLHSPISPISVASAGPVSASAS
jgi:hypothetical protein